MMTLIKHNRKPAFPSIFDDFFMRDLFHDDFVTRAKGTSPAVNIVEHDDAFGLAFAAPGLKKEDFKIELENETLVVSAEVSTEEETKGKFARKEFNYGSFERRFKLPKSADMQEIGATYEDGILNISIPKREEAKVQAPRQISIA